MAQAPITIKLEEKEDGREATIRSFVRNKDRKAIQKLSLKGTEISPKDIKDDEVNVKLKGENIIEVTNEQVRRLLISYNGNTENPYDELMESEHEKDLESIEEAVQKVFDKGGDQAKK